MFPRMATASGQVAVAKPGENRFPFTRRSRFIELIENAGATVNANASSTRAWSRGKGPPDLLLYRNAGHQGIQSGTTSAVQL
jgi:hypothetical protein